MNYDNKSKQIKHRKQTKQKKIKKEQRLDEQRKIQMLRGTKCQFLNI